VSAGATNPVVVVLHGAGGDAFPPDEQDVLDEVESVCPLLGELGYSAVPVAVSLEFGRLAERMAGLRPVVVFNLVESIEGQGCYAHLASAWLDAKRIPYTGCPTAAIHRTTDKLLAKEILIAAGIPTPQWFASEGRVAAGDGLGAGRWILKPVFEDASIGLDAGAVVEAGDVVELCEHLSRREKIVRLDLFAEAFIDGREIAVSMIEGAEGLIVLPPAEILFKDFPPERPRIVDYPAKWAPDSFEYIHTVRCMEFGEKDAAVLGRVRELAARCWDLFGLRGYARVDFRIDDAGCPWVIDVNTNPSLGKDSGFIAAVRQSGRDSAWAINRLVQAAFCGKHKTSNNT
jgi:D-alanine-D-alanine ligase